MTEEAKRYQFGKELAIEAGARAKHFFQNRHELVIERKSNAFDLISAADKNVEALIRAKIESAFPHDAILGEEKGVSGSQKAEYMWIIDPIDGTMPFLHGMPLWCVSIGLVRNGKPIMGFVMDANMNELFHAWQAHGAFCNESPIKAMAGQDLTQGSIATGEGTGARGELAKELILNIFEKELSYCRPIPCALTLAWVAAGRLMAACYPFVWAWDWAAGVVLVEEAGGRTSNPFANNGIAYGNGILASGAGVYDALYKMGNMDAVLKLDRDIP